MKKTVLLFTFLSLMIGSTIIAQSGYQSGYIITVNNDTIQGYLLSDLDANMAEHILFKEGNTSSEELNYTTRDLLGFGFESGREFKRMKLDQSEKEVGSDQYVFAKNLSKGMIDLYVWRHQKLGSQDFFVFNNQNQREAQLSRPKSVKIKNDGKTYSKKDKRYQYLLNYVMQINQEEGGNYKKIRYSERSIRRNISSYNYQFQNKYQQIEYNEPTENNYEILAGMPLNFKPEEIRFRVGVYLNRIKTDKTYRFSTFSAITYNHSDLNLKQEDLDKLSKNGSKNFKSQILNLIPIGLKFQSKAKNIIPYGYIGIGAMLLVNSNYLVNNYEITDTEKQYFPLPTVNVGGGLKIRTKSSYILAEITPTFSGVFFNLGYSF